MIYYPVLAVLRPKVPAKKFREMLFSAQRQKSDLLRKVTQTPLFQEIKSLEICAKLFQLKEIKSWFKSNKILVTHTRIQ